MINIDQKSKNEMLIKLPILKAKYLIFSKIFRRTFNRIVVFVFVRYVPEDILPRDLYILKVKKNSVFDSGNDFSSDYFENRFFFN